MKGAMQTVEVFFAFSIAIASVVISIVGFVGYLGPLEDQLQNITLFLLGTIAAYLAFERRGHLQEITQQSRMVSDSLKPISAYFDYLDKGDGFSRLLIRAGLSTQRSVQGTERIDVGPEEVFELWVDALQISSSFLAHNRVLPDEVWGTTWADKIALALQGAHVAKGNSIRRLFIYDTEEEVEGLQTYIASQKRIGIEVRQISKGDYDCIRSIEYKVEGVRSQDFVIIDEDIVLYVDLDQERSIVGATLLRSQQEAKKLRSIMMDAWEASSECG